MKLVCVFLVCILMLSTVSFSFSANLQPSAEGENFYKEGMKFFEEKKYKLAVQSLLAFIVMYSSVPEVAPKIREATEVLSQMRVDKVVVRGLRDSTVSTVSLWQLFEFFKSNGLSALALEGGLFGLCAAEVLIVAELAERKAKREWEFLVAEAKEKGIPINWLRIKWYGEDEIDPGTFTGFENYVSLPVASASRSRRFWERHDRKTLKFKKEIEAQVEECFRKLQEAVDATKDFYWLDTVDLRASQPAYYDGEPYGFNRYFINGDKISEFSVKVVDWDSPADFVFGLQVTSYIINIEEAGVHYAELQQIVREKGIKYKKIEGAVQKRYELLRDLALCLFQKGIRVRVIIETGIGDMPVGPEPDYYWAQKLQEVRQMFNQAFGPPVSSTDPVSELANGFFETVWKLIP